MQIRVQKGASAVGEGAHVRAQVKRIEQLSDEKHVHLKINGSTPFDAVTLCHDLSGFEPGCEVDVTFTSSFWFDASGQRLRA